ncbi:urate hydroxylase PuuD [Bradyrhizobium jicamae]|uniref:Urate hydroxylase PuuD n=1 Tax=Bradyrhizobium jicamae TaxID=280332 RepID=A0ABS5FET7_9BRAD|nr:urate hydroxylase PuuD [Bradyrhizobium jicamae]MBR0795293.1 urate hydroxylase PuuD [Bradyrhizobium jicamae]
MIPYVLEWGSLLLRWLHVIAAMAWIGSSFFFMHLDASLRAAPDLPAARGGVGWQVHGGGFYEMRKYLVAPDFMPEELTWHKWQAYTTWISGFFLLVWIYYAQSSLYLVNPEVMALTGPQASAIGIGALAVGWLIYDRLCKSPLGNNETLLGLIGLAVIVAASYGFTLVFSGRGTLIHVGALMATWMAGNVFMVIIPNQRKVVASLMAGEAPDPALGKQAKQRSTHNNYLTLPAVLLMLSNHYPVLYANPAVIPPIVFLITISGALIRHFYNVRHFDHAKSPWWVWATVAVALWLTFWIAMASSPTGRAQLGLAATPAAVSTAAAHTSPPANVVEIVTSRCAMCHAADPVWDGIQISPKGVLLDTPAHIARQAEAINLQAVVSRAMPPNNITEMTADERLALAAWLRSATN